MMASNAWTVLQWNSIKTSSGKRTKIILQMLGLLRHFGYYQEVIRISPSISTYDSPACEVCCWRTSFRDQRTFLFVVDVRTTTGAAVKSPFWRFLVVTKFPAQRPSAAEQSNRPWPRKEVVAYCDNRGHQSSQVPW